MKSEVVVIDYGMGNLHSVAKALEHVSDSVTVSVSGDAAVIAAADRIVFPGVGAIRDCMAEIKRLGLDNVVVDAIDEKPVLAICVGMQAVMTHSDENGGVDCLNILPGRVKRFPGGVDQSGQRLKVPHMGWSQVNQQIDHPMWQSIASGSRFYFVHSYYVRADVREQVMATVDYGVEFDAVLSRGSLFTAQFHPEKSGDVGLQLLKNFLSWDGKP